MGVIINKLVSAMGVIINKLVSANANADADTNAEANDWVTT